MSDISQRERHMPTQQELEELLEILVGAADEGQLIGLVFVLQNEQGQQMVDYRGTMEVVEVGTRVVRERIAEAMHTAHPQIAAAIRSDLAAGRTN